MYCFEKSEAIYEYAPKFLVRDKFPFLVELDEFIRLADASGLIMKWSSSLRVSHNFDHPLSYGLLTLQTHFGGYMITSCVILFSFSLFILEIIVYNNARKQNASKFWLLLQMFIDPDRHFWLENKLK